MDSLRVTLVQTILYWESPEKNRSHFDSIFQQIESTDLLILPELFTTAFSVSAKAETMYGITIDWLKQKAIQLDCVIIGSLIIQENKSRYNRLVCVYPNKDIFCYDKRHLFTLMNEDKYFSSGESKLIVDVKGWKICPLICYDLRFPVFSRNKENYDLLIYVANWPSSRISQWKKLLPARAIENQSYVIAVNRIGQDFNQIEFDGSSFVIDYEGKVLESLMKKDICLTTELSKSSLNKYRKRFPFLNDKDDFTIY